MVHVLQRISNKLITFVFKDMCLTRVVSPNSSPSLDNKKVKSVAIPLPLPPYDFDLKKKRAWVMFMDWKKEKLHDKIRWGSNKNNRFAASKVSIMFHNYRCNFKLFLKVIFYNLNSSRSES